MARSTTEIQADIEVTRRRIETQLDALRHRLPDRWWVPYAVLGGALVVGVLASRMSMLRVVGTGARTVQTGLAVASMLAAVDRFMAQRPQHREAA